MLFLSRSFWRAFALLTISACGIVLLFKPDTGRAVRYGDALHLVTCPVLSSDPTHTGRSLRKPHVLTCFKKETSSLLGGYLTIDPRGYALQFVVERPPPELDVVISA